MTDYLFSQLNDSQLYALAIIPKITGTLSWVGSLSIICHCLSPAGKLNTQKRLLCVLSLGDMMCSIGQIVSTWAIPSDTIYDSFVKFNIGNQLTCNVQGFLLQFGSVLALFNNVFLCINYLLRGRHKWSIAKIASKAEPIFHAIGFLVSIFLSLVPLFYEMYNPGITRCWIIEYPLLCTKKDDRECIRGEKAFMFRTIVAIIAITCFIFMIVSFKLLYNAVKMEEEKLRSTSSEEDREDEGDRNSMHKKISRESLFYLVPFFIVYAPFVFATFIFTSLKTNATAVFIMFLFLVTCMPIQGLLNAIVYFRVDISEQVQGMSSKVKFCAKDDLIPQSEQSRKETDGRCEDEVKQELKAKSVPDLNELALHDFYMSSSEGNESSSSSESKVWYWIP